MCTASLCVTASVCVIYLPQNVLDWCILNTFIVQTYLRYNDAVRFLR